MTHFSEHVLMRRVCCSLATRGAGSRTDGGKTGQRFGRTWDSPRHNDDVRTNTHDIGVTGGHTSADMQIVDTVQRVDRPCRVRRPLATLVEPRREREDEMMATDSRDPSCVLERAFRRMLTSADGGSLRYDLAGALVDAANEVLDNQDAEPVITVDDLNEYVRSLAGPELLRQPTWTSPSRSTTRKWEPAELADLLVTDRDLQQVIEVVAERCSLLDDPEGDAVRSTSSRSTTPSTTSTTTSTTTTTSRPCGRHGGSGTSVERCGLARAPLRDAAPR